MRIAVLAASPTATTWASSAPRKPRITVSPFVFTCYWLAVVLVHFVCFVFTAALAGTHALVATPAMYTYTASTLQIDIKYLRLAAKAIGCVSVLHVLSIGRIFYYSLRKKQLCFRIHNSPASQRPLTRPSTKIIIVAVLLWPFRLLVRLWNRYFGIDGLFGLNGVYFDNMFLAREVLEMLSQTYQAYFMSSLLSTQWINHVAVATIVLGCISTPMIHALVRRHKRIRRFACLVIDTTLDFCGAVVLPLTILYDNLAHFDWHRMEFPIELVYDQVWMAKLISRSRLLFVWSYLDFASTVILQVGVLGSILAIENSVVRRPRPRTTAPSPNVHLLSTVVPLTITAAKSRRSTSFHSRRRVASAAIPIVTRMRVRRRLCFGAHTGVFFAWGVFVLFAHLNAQRDTTKEVPACALGVNEWFEVRPSCSVVTIHCYRLGIEGAAAQVSTILDPLDRYTLVALAVMHCPRFVMPDILQEFTHLTSIELTNVTLVAWPATAAVHQDYHHALSHIFLGHVTLTEFPVGLLHADLPLALNDLGMSFVNLTALPEELGELWSNRLWLRLFVENANLTELPASLASLRIRRVSFAANHLTSIDDRLFQGRQLTELYLSGNPLEKLPATLGDPLTLEHLVAEHTNIRETNEWFDSWFSRKMSSTKAPVVSLFGSPVCASLSYNMQRQVCATDSSTSNGTDSWELIWRLRPVH